MNDGCFDNVSCFFSDVYSIIVCVCLMAVAVSPPRFFFFFFVHQAKRKAPSSPAPPVSAKKPPVAPMVTVKKPPSTASEKAASAGLSGITSQYVRVFVGGGGGGRVVVGTGWLKARGKVATGKGLLVGVCLYCGPGGGGRGGEL